MKQSTKKALVGSFCTFLVGCCLIFAGLMLGGISTVKEVVFTDGPDVFYLENGVLSGGGVDGIYIGNGVLSIGGADGIYIGNGIFTIGGADGIYIGNGIFSIGGANGLRFGSDSHLSRKAPIVDEASISSISEGLGDSTSGIALEDTFHSIEVNISVGEIIITQSGDQFSVATDDIANSNYFIENRGDTLYIGDQGTTNAEAKNSQIIISVPVGADLEELSLYTKCGNITVNDLNSVSTTVLLNTDLGDIWWSGTTQKLTAVSSLGDITLLVPMALQTISYDLSTSLGKVSVNTRTYGDNTCYEVIEAPMCSIYANSALGDVSLLTES